jgi:hypothetical protein
MSFRTHTFEINAHENGRSFAFHESVGEGQELYFLAKFSEDAINPQEAAEILFGEIVDTMKNSSIQDGYDRFEESLKASNLQGAKLRKNFGKTPDIVVAYFDFHQLYLSQSGGAEAYLIRSGALSQISEPTDGSNDLFFNILSGQVSIDDSVIFASNRLLRSVTSSQLIELFERNNFDESCSSLRQALVTQAEENILVTAVGIGKKNNVGTAGFLSKVVSKVKGGKSISNSVSVPMAEATAANKTIEKTTDTNNTEDYNDDTPSLAMNIPDSPQPRELPPLTDSFAPSNNFRQNMSNGKKFDPTQTISMIKQSFHRLTAFQLKAIAGAILAIIIVGIGFRSIGNFESTATAELRAELQIAREAITQADTFLIQGDREEASAMLDQAQDSAQKVLNSKSSNFRFDAQTILADIQEKQLAVENARKVDPQVLADLGIKNDNVVATGLLPLRGNLYAYDTKSYYKTVRNIVETGINITEKESILIGATRPDQNTLVFLTDGPRIVESKNGIISPMSTSDDVWKSGIDLKTFGRYIYILDPLENQIWKYQRRSASYSGASAYNQGVDLSRAVSIAIDGSIYVLSDDGTLQKLFRGTKADFAFRNLPSVPFEGKNLRLYTTQNLDFIYVLDPDNSRILIFEKGDRFATYRKQVIFDKIDNAVDFSVDESGQKANIITTDKIYEFSL